MISIQQPQGEVFPSTSTRDLPFSPPFLFFRGEITDTGSGGDRYPSSELHKQKSEALPPAQPKKILSLESIIFQTTKPPEGIGRTIVECVETQPLAVKKEPSFIPGVKPYFGVSQTKEFVPTPVYHHFTPQILNSYGHYTVQQERSSDYQSEEEYQASESVEYQATSLEYASPKIIDARPLYQHPVVGREMKSYSPSLILEYDLPSSSYRDQKGRIVEGATTALETRVGKEITQKKNYLEAFANLLQQSGYNVEIQQSSYTDTDTGKKVVGSILVDNDDPNAFYHLFVDGHVLEYQNGEKSPYEVLQAKEGQYLKAVRHTRDLGEIDSSEFISQSGQKGVCLVDSERTSLEGMAGLDYRSVAEGVMRQKGYAGYQIENAIQSGALSVSGQRKRGELGGDAIESLEQAINKDYVSLEVSVDLGKLKEFYR